MKLSIAITSLIVGVMVAGACFHFNPAVPIFAILGFGIWRLGRTAEPLPSGGNPTHWGSGHGIYFDKDDVWVHGSACGAARSAECAKPSR